MTSHDNMTHWDMYSVAKEDVQKDIIFDNVFLYRGHDESYYPSKNRVVYPQFDYNWTGVASSIHVCNHYLCHIMNIYKNDTCMICGHKDMRTHNPNRTTT